MLLRLLGSIVTDTNMRIRNFIRSINGICLLGAGVLKLCTEAIFTWLSHIGLALNPSKSEAVQFGDAKGGIVNDNPKLITVVGADIPLTPVLESPGVILDSRLSKVVNMRHNQLASGLIQLIFCRHVRT